MLVTVAQMALARSFPILVGIARSFLAGIGMKRQLKTLLLRGLRMTFMSAAKRLQLIRASASTALV
jgi:hypothetical protein